MLNILGKNRTFLNFADVTEKYTNTLLRPEKNCEYKSLTDRELKRELKLNIKFLFCNDETEYKKEIVL